VVDSNCGRRSEGHLVDAGALESAYLEDICGVALRAFRKLWKLGRRSAGALDPAHLEDICDVALRAFRKPWKLGRRSASLCL